MAQQVTLGGERLGSGKDLKVNTRTYDRSTHNLSYVWRSSMAPGTLVPYLNEVALPGDTWDINLNADVKTLPTLGPLFGSFKLQLDVFTVPIRLYVSQLHNNKLGVGMNMSSVKLPQLKVTAPNPLGTNVRDMTTYTDDMQIANNSILKYLGVSGIGYDTNTNKEVIERKINAIPFLGYWDIFKNYYANKQEKKALVIHKQIYNTEHAQWSTIELFENEIFNKTIANINGNGVLKSSDQIAIRTNWKMVIYGRNMKLNSFEIGTDDEKGQYNYQELINLNWTFNQINPDVIEIYMENWEQGDILITDVFIKSYEEGSKIELQSFDLENIDRMREKLLTNPGQVVINDDNAELAPYSFINAKLSIETDLITDFQTAIASEMEGLALKTYQSDIFNNWLNEEWIDGINGISEITKVSTAGGGFTIDTLNLSKKVYDMLNQIAVSGGSYDDWIRTVYDTNYVNRAETPVYQGGLSKEVVFNEVVATAGSEFGDSQDPIGTLAGRGVLSDKHKGGKLTIRVDEPSYIMGIVSITPRIDYSQGNKWDINLKTLDDLHKPALDGIGFQDLITEQMHWGEAEIDGNNVKFRSAGKQPAWLNYMTNYNKTYGDFADENKAMFMTLNRRYKSQIKYDGQKDIVEISDLTSYIDPKKFNEIFADARLNANNFWVQIAVNADARRKMSAKIIPNL